MERRKKGGEKAHLRRKKSAVVGESVSRRHLIGEDGLDLLLDFETAVVGTADDDVEEEMREELLSDDGVFEVEEPGEGVEDLLRDGSLDILKEVVGEGADPVAVRGRRAINRILGLRHGLEVTE
jgi:hypothetical protein